MKAIERAIARLPGFIKYPLYILIMFAGANIIALGLVPFIIGGAALLAAMVILSAITG